jgi:alkylation response protein AidB-like acyl-CoA dehydrogenase
VNLELTDSETDVVDQAARVFRALAPVGRRRAGTGPGVWTALAEAGWTELGAALEGGLMEIGAALGVFCEAGRQLLSEQFVTSAYLVSALVAHCRGAEREALETGLRGRPGILLADGRQPGLVGDGSGYGFCFGVEEPPDVFRVRPGPGDGTWVIGVLEGADVDIRPLAGLSFAAGPVEVRGGRWRDVRVDVDAADLSRIERTAMLLHSAALVGCAEEALTTTRDYASGRIQFGVPIGSFQAVKHGLADVHTGNQVAWSAILCAAASGGDPYRVLVARLLAVEGALAAARAAAQFHGGIGFTWESDVHLYLKAVLDGAQRFGAPDDIATAIGERFVVGQC